MPQTHAVFGEQWVWALHMLFLPHIRWCMILQL